MKLEQVNLSIRLNREGDGQYMYVDRAKETEVMKF
jgi:hypothetical protein